MPVHVQIDGQLCVAEEGECLASVIFRQKSNIFRHHPVDGSPRAAFCMMGVCFECLVEVNGLPDQQSCLIQVQDGMKIRRALND